MSEELKEINETLKKIESKIKDKNSSGLYLRNIFDFEKRNEESRKEREDERNEELLEMQRVQSENSKIQTESIKKQENFNKIIAFTGGILALTTIYAFIVGAVNLQNHIEAYWTITIILLLLIILCLGPLIKFIICVWKKEVFLG